MEEFVTSDSSVQHAHFMVARLSHHPPGKLVWPPAVGVWSGLCTVRDGVAEDHNCPALLGRHHLHTPEPEPRVVLRPIRGSVMRCPINWHDSACGEIPRRGHIRGLQRFKMPSRWTSASGHEDAYCQVDERRHVQVYWAAENDRAGRDSDCWLAAAGNGST